MEDFVAGIDVASATFAATLSPSLQEPTLAVCEFTNDDEGFEALVAWLARHGAAPERTLVCIENTGVYSEALAYWLYENGWPVALEAPLKIQRTWEDGPKNDRIDSQKIAEYAFRYRDRIRLWRPREELVEQIKTLLATREQLVGQKTASKNTLAALRRKAVQTPVAIGALEATLESLRAQIEAIMREIRRLIRQHPTMSAAVTLLISAPGVAELLSAHLLVLTEGFRQEPSYRPLAARLGIAPREHTSGTSVWRPSRSRGYGPAMARKLLYLAARSLVTHVPRYRQYYLRKVAEGKPTRLVLNNVANKLLRVLCGMLRHQMPYCEGYRSVQPMLLAT